MDCISLYHKIQAAQLQSTKLLSMMLNSKPTLSVIKPHSPYPTLRPMVRVHCSTVDLEETKTGNGLVDLPDQKLREGAIPEDEDGTGEVGSTISSPPSPPDACYMNYYKNCTFNDCRFNQHRGPEIQSRPTTEAGSGGDGSKGRFPPSGGSRGGGGKDDDDGDVYDEHSQQYKNAVEERMLNLMSIFGCGLLLASYRIIWNPTLASLAGQALLSTVGIATQVVIDSCFSTFAKLLKKGMEFSARLFAEGFLLGVTVFIALGRFLATHMGLMPSAASGGFFGHVQRVYSPLRSRITKKPERENPVSSVVKNALLWGVFLPLSQIPVIRFLLDLAKMIKA